MALITCPECGKQISDKAKTCPNCGCPVSDMNTENAEDQSTPEVNANNVAGKMMNMVQSGIQTALENNKNAIHVTKTVGPVQIDEPHQKFRINGSVPVNGKKDGLGKSMFKGVMAVGTFGMSVAAEKIVGGGNKQKVGNKEWLDFSDLISYDLLEDDSLVTSGGVGQALIGGALFGGFGAVAGGITGKKVQKKKVESMIIKVTVNNFGSPCIMIPLITKSTKTNSKEYQTAFNEAHNILAALDVITHNK
ncbi:zinc ribbon domain-containing protein [Enterocloster lavalensis]|uniref:Zinc-ribbon domain-containing protein n=1 Tax=Enterocloster lavalensis TaxID=460384 RepID=A0A1I0JCF7_9FIRM|nr:zinc ribbon domain-containing protein [Enterocloster lavalensis]SEU07020.1 zinc-ribbon domain-containing protein [Enterocloster lavalensis]